MGKSNSYGVATVRGPFVKLDPHPASFDERDEDDYLDWALQLNAPSAMDLFCGAGGLSLGLHDAGFEVILGVDHDDEALNTHRANFPGLSVNWDMADDHVIDRVIDIGRQAKVDLIAGGPPCQPFSKAGRSMIRDLVRSGRRARLDDRKDLWRSFMAVVEGVRPSAVLMENVPDMALDRDMQILRTMVDLLEYLGYSAEVRVLESSRYEVPQFRQRLIVVALNDNLMFEWPEESGYQVTLRTAIGDLPDVEGGWRPEGGADGWAEYGGPSTLFQRRARKGVTKSDGHKVFDHITRPVRDDDKIIFAAMDAATSYSQVDEAVEALERVSLESDDRSTTGSLKRYRDDIFDDKYKRLDWGQVSRTITAHIAKDGYWYIHPGQDRTLTVREAARIQTFPDAFRFSGPPSAQFRQIGNAVPPRLAESLGRTILASLADRGDAGRSTTAIARTLAAWFETREETGSLRFPWLSVDETDLHAARWLVLQAELLLGRTSAETSRTLWPLIARFRLPEDSIEHAGEIREIAAWIDRDARADALIEAASWFASNPDELLTVTGMHSAPNVNESIAELASRAAPGPDDDPVYVTSGILRVAARFWGTSVDRTKTRTDGRIAVARMIGAEDDTSDHAYLAMVEIAESLCGPRRRDCADCPVRAICRSSTVGAST